jgi:hypothetical protein
VYSQENLNTNRRTWGAKKHSPQKRFKKVGAIEELVGAETGGERALNTR